MAIVGAVGQYLYKSGAEAAGVGLIRMLEDEQSAEWKAVLRSIVFFGASRARAPPACL